MTAVASAFVSFKPWLGCSGECSRGLKLLQKSSDPKCDSKEQKFSWLVLGERSHVSN